MMTDQPKKSAGITIIYDGECPFCSNFVQIMQLRKAVGKVTLLDARTCNDVVQALGAKYDLNEGMLVLFGDKTYYGPDAVAVISSLTDSRNVVAKMTALLLRNSTRAKILYPWMKFGRRLTLAALGRKALGVP